MQLSFVALENGILLDQRKLGNRAYLYKLYYFHKTK